MIKNLKAFRSLSVLLAVLLFLAGSVSPIFSAEQSNFDKIKTGFSEKLGSALEASAGALDRALIKLSGSLDKTDVLNVKVHSHFYDAKIRRYFISLSGTGIFKGKLPFKLKSDAYIVSCDQEVSYDFTFSEIRQEGKHLRFSYEGAIVFSMDRIAYECMKKIPSFAASGALSPAANLLTEFLDKLNIGILSDAISDTLKSFSTVAISRTGAELLSAAGKNQKISQLVKSSMKDGSILSFVGLSIMKCAAKSLVNVAGASLGSTLGTIVAPGPGSVIGAYIGSQILSQIASTVVYQLTVKMPLIRELKRMVRSYEILQHNSADSAAMKSYNESLTKIQKKVFNEFDSDKFSLFKLVLDKIDTYSEREREAFVPLLRKFQENLLFKVINDGDWYFAKYYHQLKASVEKWKLEKRITFTTDSAITDRN